MSKGRPSSGAALRCIAQPRAFTTPPKDGTAMARARANTVLQCSVGFVSRTSRICQLDHALVPWPNSEREYFSLVEAICGGYMIYSNALAVEWKEIGRVVNNQAVCHAEQYLARRTGGVQKLYGLWVVCRLQGSTEAPLSPVILAQEVF